MKLVCISDTHGLHEQLRLPAGDVLVHAGDLSEWGEVQEAARFLDWFGSVGAFRHRVFIAGNHDCAFDDTPELVNALIPQHVTYLNDSGATLDGVQFWGSPVTPTFCRMAFNRDDHEIDRHWQLIPTGVDVLVTHAPPRGIRDGVGADARSVGCPWLARAVSERAPKVHVFGHIHEGHGQQQQHDVLYVNAAICDHTYAPINRPQVIEIPA